MLSRQSFRKILIDQGFASLPLNLSTIRPLRWQELFHSLDKLLRREPFDQDPIGAGVLGYPLLLGIVSQDETPGLRRCGIDPLQYSVQLVAG